MPDQLDVTVTLDVRQVAALLADTFGAACLPVVEGLAATDGAGRWVAGHVTALADQALEIVDPGVVDMLTATLAGAPTPNDGPWVVGDPIVVDGTDGTVAAVDTQARTVDVRPTIGGLVRGVPFDQVQPGRHP